MGRHKKNVKDIDTSRSRNWTIVLYPESAPENWRSILDEQYIEWIESPLHDKDVNPTGEPKKPHLHLLLMFGGVKSYDQVKYITDMLNCPIPMRCHNAKSLVRYMIHADNPDKYQYDRKGIIPHGGADIDSIFMPTKAEEDSLLTDIFLLINDYNILEISDLVNYFLKKSDYDHFEVLKTRHCFINSYLSSFRNKILKSEEKK